MATDPAVREESVLRRSLRPGLLRSVAFNQDRRNPDLGLFEIGHAWPGGGSADAAGLEPAELAPGRGLPDEREILGVVLSGAGPDGRGGDAAAAVRVLYRLVGAVRAAGVELRVAESPGMHPTRSALVCRDGDPIGVAGEIDPDVAAAWGIDGRVGWLEVELPALLAGVRVDEAARAPSRFPSSDIDLAFAVESSEPAAAVQASVAAAGGELLEWVRLFDVYRGPGVPEGARSLAFRLRFVAPDRTLTEAELAEARQRCIDAVERAHPATLRA